MELYTMGRDFVKDKVIDEFKSAIWTERYSDIGDFRLEVPDTTIFRNVIREGGFMGEASSDQVMIVETVASEKGVMVVKGRDLTSFFEERQVQSSADRSVTSYIRRGTPGSLMGDLVKRTLVDGTWGETFPIGGTVNHIEGLTIGNVDTSRPTATIEWKNGTLDENIRGAAQRYNLGYGMFLVSTDPLALVFSTYSGINRTSAQDQFNPVVFSPGMDSLSNIKELRSIAGYKTCAVVYPPSNLAGGYVVGYAPGSGPGVKGFDRRVMVVEAQITDEMLVGTTLIQLMQEAAANALANNNYIRMFDGELVQQPDYKFGVHYNLGDIVELNNGYAAQAARITEFIRSQDQRGERAYPTVSVLPPKAAQVVVSNNPGSSDGGILYG